jgi:hypothetical protein
LPTAASSMTSVTTITHAPPMPASTTYASTRSTRTACSRFDDLPLLGRLRAGSGPLTPLAQPPKPSRQAMIGTAQRCRSGAKIATVFLRSCTRADLSHPAHRATLASAIVGLVWGLSIFLLLFLGRLRPLGTGGAGRIVRCPFGHLAVDRPLLQHPLPAALPGVAEPSHCYPVP